ncbi:MAG: alkyl sulfatase dimerization domain-containing protein, partial [Acidimicrobiales bacterium]
AAELCALAGGPGVLCERALALIEEPGEATDRLAGHLVETAWLAAPQDPAIAEARRRVFSTLAQRTTSTMSRGVFTHAAREAARTNGRIGTTVKTD